MSSIFDHVGIAVSDFEKSRAFYTEALATLGIELLTEFSHGGIQHVAYGIGRPTFWVSSGKRFRGDGHICFAARSRSEVAAFHAVALSMGGRDNGPPGIRAHYHPNYFGAFVFDPDGHNIEAVCHDPE